MDWNGKTVLITGGSGSLGHALTTKLLTLGVQSIRIFSRGEHRQEQMARHFSEESKETGRLRFFIGDVRDADRLKMASKLVDCIIHCAALKIVPACAYNPFETLETNVLGSRNVINAALTNHVPQVVAVSTDKAVEPVTLYGASKAMMEHLFIASNNYRGESHESLFSVVRYGNVSCSRGSILPLVLTLRKNGVLTLTDARSTRFWLQQKQAVDLVLTAFEYMRGGEIFIPKAPSMKVTDLMSTLAPDCRIEKIGLRAQEKLHEVLVTWEEARRTRDAGKFFVIEPEGVHWRRQEFDHWPFVPAGFRYTSAGSDSWVTREQFIKEAEEFERSGVV